MTRFIPPVALPQTEFEYKIYLKDRAVKDFLRRVFRHVISNHRGYMRRNIDILLSDLEDVERADFSNPETEKPF